MPNKILVERFNVSPMTYIAESVTSDDGHRRLGRFEGPAADLNNPTRNGHKYNLKLWRNVENSDDFKEGMETLTIFGEVDHPETRLESLLKEAAIVLRKFEIRENEGIVWCSFDILDTPGGRTLKAICDYGSKIGISSRGSGEEIEDENGEVIIDPDTYLFIAFDAVVMPAVKFARQSVVESAGHDIPKNISDSIMDEIKSASTLSELKSIESILESSNLPNLASMKEAIDIKSKEISNGDNISSKLLEDLGRSAQEISDLKNENSRLQDELSANNIRIESLRKSRDMLSKSVETLRRSLISNKSESSDLKKSLVESSRRLKESDSRNHSLMRRISNLSNSLQNCRSELTEARSRISEMTNRLTESSSKRTRTESLLRKQIEDLSSEKDSLESDIENLKEENQKLSDNRRSLVEKISDLEEKSKRFRSLADENQSKASELSKTLDSYLSENRKLSKMYEDISSQNSSLKSRNSELKSESMKIVETYLKMKSVQTGISTQTIKARLPESFSMNDIDRVVAELADRNSRMSKLPVAIPNVNVKLNESSSPIENQLSDEDAQTYTILSSVSKNM